MRLIDAEALTDEIKENKKILQKGLGKDAEFAYISADSVLKTIYNQPTAYDPDKVVEQLEKLKKAEQDRPDDCDEDGCGDGEQIYDDGRSQGRYEAFGKAIQIVKGGGVDG